MRKKISIIMAGSVVLFAIVIFAWTLVRSLWYAPQNDAEVAAPVATTTPNMPALPPAAHSEKPTRLSIPSLHIDAAIQYVGITKNGNMATPNNFKDVGWYKNGTIPGNVGSAVMAGHVDNALALPGVFKHLGDLHAGDDIYVITEAGSKLHFVVSDKQVYPYTDAPTELLFNQHDVPRLNLITCDGTWDQRRKTYDKRLVVFSELATE